AGKRDLYSGLRAQYSREAGGRERREAADAFGLRDQRLNQHCGLTAGLPPYDVVARAQIGAEVKRACVRHEGRRRRASASTACARTRYGRSSITPLWPIVPAPGLAANRSTISCAAASS